MICLTLNDVPGKRVQMPVGNIMDDTEYRTVQPGPWLVPGRIPQTKLDF